MNVPQQFLSWKAADMRLVQPAKQPATQYAMYSSHFIHETDKSDIYIICGAVAPSKHVVIGAVTQLANISLQRYRGYCQRERIALRKSQPRW